jgi:PilZ domain
MEASFPRKEVSMRAERRREPRFPFIATAEIVDEQEDSRTSSRLSDLSLHGCYVEIPKPFPEGTSVLIEIFKDDDFMETHATVAFVEPRHGMGLTFREVPACFSGVLNKWLQEAGKRKTA